MASELTPDQILRAVAALEAAWTHDDIALAALARGGHEEESLAVLVAEYGSTALKTMVLVAAGLQDLEEADQQEAMEAFREGLVSHTTMLAVGMLQGWALSAGGTVEATGDFARGLLKALLTFATDGDDDEDVLAFIALLRADALANS